MPQKNTPYEVKIPHSSGFDMSHRNSGSLTCGTLTPLLVEECIPGTKCNLRTNIAVQLPPLVSDTYMNLKLKVEAFCIPMRLLCRSFEDWFNDFPKRTLSFASATSSSTGRVYTNVKAKLPVLRLPASVSSSVYKPGSLLDYLGFKVESITADYVDISPLSLFAYHLVYQEFYRNPRVQNPAFVEDLGISGSASSSVSRLPSIIYKYFCQTDNLVQDNSLINLTDVNLNYMKLADGVGLFDLRQRNFGYDFFTGARPSAQQGNAAQVSIALPEGAETTGFSIAQLRAANSLQMFRERNRIPSPRFVDQLYARYGVRPSDGVAQRPILIGSATYDVISRGVDQTGGVSEGASPFNSVGSQYGRAYGVGSDFIIDNFEVVEPSFIMVLQSLVPEVTYSSGVAPYLRRYIAEGSVTEMATPLLQNIGDEPIKAEMLSNDFDQETGNDVFGFQDRFGSFMFHSNECHGLLRDGQSLESISALIGSSPIF